VGFEVTKVDYSGKIREVAVGQGDKIAKIGGENCYPFHIFEGSMPNRPLVAMEVWDMEPTEWAEAKGCSAPLSGW